MLKRWNVRLPRKWGGYFRNDADHRDFAAIGTAAGAAQTSGLLKLLLVCVARFGAMRQPAKRQADSIIEAVASPSFTAQA